MPKRSAGLLVYRRVDGEPEVLLVHPGGPYLGQEGRRLVVAARRASTNRTRTPSRWRSASSERSSGSSPPERTSPTFLGELRQPGGKLVSAWALPGDLDVSVVRSNTFTMEWPPRSGRTAEFPEVDRAGWFDLETARRKLLRGQLGLLDRFSELLNAGSME